MAQRDSIKKQEEEIKAQKKAYDNESFESTFFNLLNVQQNITNDLKTYFLRLSDLTTIQSYSVTGREFFRVAVKERFKINQSLSNDEYVGMYDDSEDQLLNDKVEQIIEEGRHEPYPYYAEEKINALVKKRRMQLINKRYQITQSKWEEARATEGVERVMIVYDLFFDQFHYAAGHYFRNLYHIIKYVRQFEVIQRRRNKNQSEDERIKKRCYQYAQFIQAQMSSPELALLHDNSLAYRRMRKLVKKYDLLENCALDGLMFKVNYVD